jgi:HTH-type transcriptional regulator/antitoxin HigA
METRERIWPDIAIPPGELLAETLEALGMSQAELARRMGRPAQAINEMVQGKKEITPETALQFERVLGTPAHVWVGLESDYRFLKAKLEEAATLQAQAPLAEQFPFGEMAALQWVRAVTKPGDRVRELLRFFGVAGLQQVELPAVAWRRAKVAPSRHALAAWLREGERRAQRVQVPDYDPDALNALVVRLRSLTLDEQNFGDRLRQWLHDCGVVVVFVEELKHTGAHGVTRWIGKRPVMQLSIFYRWYDIFWFTVFHEIAHILRHRRDMFIELEGGASNGEAEEDANRFAADALIPPGEYARFLQQARTPLSEHTVRRFADRIGVHPSVVIGRLQHDSRLPRTHLNGLRPRLQWKETKEQG